MHTQAGGMRAFTIIWAGQLVSLVGTAMTQFAIIIWAFERTGEATSLALLGFFTFGPTVIFSPIAGALVDRLNRKLMMMVSDFGAGLATISLLVLSASGNLDLWHLYVAGFVAGATQAFQFPAYSAAITMMIPKEQYTRASGLMSLAESGSQIIAPALAAAIFGLVGLSAVLTIDVVTFSFAFATLLIVRIPQPAQTDEGRAGAGNLRQESIYGFRYILKRRSLLGVQMVFFIINLTAFSGVVLLAPMILARTGNDELLLGSVQSIGAIGGLVGSLLLSTWGGPKRRIHGVLMSMILLSLFGETLMGLGRGIVVWSAASFALAFFIPILNGSNQAIWQAKVAPDVQGRVFATRRLIAQITGPVAMLIAGPLADKVFEPAMAEGGSLVGTFGGLLGSGPGAGMSLMFVITGLVSAVAALLAYTVPFIRNVEDLLPDHDALVAEPSEEETSVDAAAAVAQA